MTVADYLAKRLKDHGVKRVFGIPGGASVPFLEALREGNIEFVLTSHESAAAVMADVSARLTGITGVCHATYGPGAVNLASGVGGAFLDRSPVIAFTSELSDEWLNRTVQMNISHQALFAPLTKATFRMSEENVSVVIDRAFETANSEFPGPVHIGLPDGLLSKNQSFGYAGDTADRQDRECIVNERAALLAASSRRPLIAAGLTAVRCKAGRELLRFLSDHRVPVIVTPMAKSIIPSDHECFGGVLFHAASDRIRKLVEAADLIIGLGYDPVEYNYESWIPAVPLIHCSTIESDMPDNLSLSVTGTPSEWFETLKHLGSSDEMVSLAGEVRKEISASLNSPDERFTAVSILQILRRVLKNDSIITADVGSHLHLIGQMWDLTGDDRLIITNGWSSMGFALPAANAAAMCFPRSTVVCITGDGGFAMSAGEILTARRYGLKVIVIVLADGELNLIKLKESWKGIKHTGVDLYHGHLFGSDSFLGVKVLHASDKTTMTKALQEAMNSHECTIIEAAIDPSVYGELIVKT